MGYAKRKDDMMIDATRLSEKGQMVIPKSIRTKMGLREGQVLIAYSDGSKMVVRPMTGMDVIVRQAMKDLDAGKTASHEDLFEK